MAFLNKIKSVAKKVYNYVVGKKEEIIAKETIKKKFKLSKKQKILLESSLDKRSLAAIEKYNTKLSFAVKKKSKNIIEENITDLEIDLKKLKPTNKKNKRDILKKSKELGIYIDRLKQIEEEEPLKRGLRKSELKGDRKKYRNVEIIKNAEDDFVKKALNEKNRNLLIFERLVDSLKIGNYKRILYQLNRNLSLEDFYDQITDAVYRTNSGVAHVDIVFKEVLNGVITNKATFKAISGDNLKTYSDFKDAIEELLKGANYEGEYWENLALQTNVFFISYANIVQHRGYGFSDSILFEHVGIKGYDIQQKVVEKEEMCGYKCLKIILGRDIDKIDKTIEDFTLVKNIIKICQDFDIKVFSNKFDIITDMNSIDSREYRVVYTKNKLGNKKVRNNLHKIYDEDISLKSSYINCNIKQKYKHSIIYDPLNKHFDLTLNTDPVLRDDVFITNKCNIFIGDKFIFTPIQLMKNALAYQSTTNLLYCFFDYETVVDYNCRNLMNEYSISYSFLTENDLLVLEKLDKTDNSEEIKTFSYLHCYNKIGFDCSKKFLEDVEKKQSEGNRIVFCGFNNALFDNFLLYKACLKSKQEFDLLNVSNELYNGNMLLDFTISGKHHTFDLARHIASSLKDACSGFKVKCCSKKEMNHDKIQRMYNNLGNDEFIKQMSKDKNLVEYNNFDVLATAVIFQRYQNILNSIEITEDVRLHENITIGSMVFKIFSKNCKKLGIKFDKLDVKQYQDLQKDRVAGRVELPNGVVKIMERMVSMDVCSLYPYVMSVLNVYYPHGKKIEVGEKDIKSKKAVLRGDYIGFFYCDFDQTILKSKNLANIYPLKDKSGNNWDHPGPIKNVLLSSIMINSMLKYGVKVDIKSGFYFEKKIKSCEMFNFLLVFMKIKNGEDTKKDKGEEYNDALRTTIKLLLNCLSGKVIESLHLNAVESVDEFKLNQIMTDGSKVNMINAVGDKLYVSYEKNINNEIDKQRPIFLGVLIYDYAKRYMYENCYAPVGLSNTYYKDTDASKFPHSCMNLFTNHASSLVVPHWQEVENYDSRYKDHKIYQEGSKVFGSFENELGDNDLFICVEKKSWLCLKRDVYFDWVTKLKNAYLKRNNKSICQEGVEKEISNILAINGEKGDKLVKMKFKGINGRALLLNSETYNFLNRKVAKNGIISYQVNNSKEAFDYFSSCDERKIMNGNQLELFEKVLAKEQTFVMMNNFKKCVKNTSREVELGDSERYNKDNNCLKMQYIVKRIFIGDKNPKEDEDWEDCVIIKKRQPKRYTIIDMQNIGSPARPTM
jgi:hypothetical protein